MNRARRYAMLFQSRCDLRNACTWPDSYGVAHGLTPEELIEQLQTVHAVIRKNAGMDDWAERLLEMICDFEAELQTDSEPELDGFRTIEPATLDRRIDFVTDAQVRDADVHFGVRA